MRHAVERWGRNAGEPFCTVIFGLLAAMLVIPTLAHAQESVPFTAEKKLAPGMLAVPRHVEKLAVPRKGKASVAIQAELSGWISTGRAREITIPAQGFYIATLGNGSAVTVFGGEEKLRHVGEMWAVPEGRPMTVKIVDTKQENVVLHIFLLRPSH